MRKHKKTDSSTSNPLNQDSSNSNDYISINNNENISINPFNDINIDTNTIDNNSINIEIDERPIEVNLNQRRRDILRRLITRNPINRNLRNRNHFTIVMASQSEQSLESINRNNNNNQPVIILSVNPYNSERGINNSELTPNNNNNNNIRIVDFFRGSRNNSNLIDFLFTALSPYFNGFINGNILKDFNEKIKSLKKIKYMNVNKFLLNLKIDLKEKNIEKNCLICLEEFELKKFVYLLNCTHLFHKKCINSWLKSSDHCPVCRQDVITLC